MSRDIKLDKKPSQFSEAEREYVRQRPWLMTDELRQALEDQEVEEGAYEDQTKKQLRIELKRRDLDYSDANKDELIARLAEDDQARAAEEAEEGAEEEE